MEYFGTPLIDGRLDESLRHQNYNVRDSEDPLPRRVDALQGAVAGERERAGQQPGVLARRRPAMAQRRGVRVQSGHAARSIASATSASCITRSRSATPPTCASSTSCSAARITSPSGFDVNHVRFTHVNDFDDPQFDAQSSVPLRNFDPGVFLDLSPTIPRFRTQTDQYSRVLRGPLRRQRAVVADRRRALRPRGARSHQPDQSRCFLRRFVQRHQLARRRGVPAGADAVVLRPVLDRGRSDRLADHDFGVGGRSSI